MCEADVILALSIVGVVGMSALLVYVNKGRIFGKKPEQVQTEK